MVLDILDNEVVRAGVNANLIRYFKNITRSSNYALIVPVTYLKVDDDGFAFVSTDNEIWYHYLQQDILF